MERVRHQQFPLFDSLRALAALSILVVHVAIFADATNDAVYGRYLAHLDIGVPFFFLLSAFLLYRPFLAARVEGTSRTSFVSYGRRRFIRIFPAFWLALTVAALVPGFVGAFTGDFWAYYGLLQNHPVFTPDSQCVELPVSCGIPVAWSLTVEVLFYAMLPLFVLATGWVARRRGSRSWLPGELWAIGALAAASVVVQSISPTTDLMLWLFYSPIGRGWWFGVGLALAALSVWAATHEREPGFVAWIRAHPGPPVALALALYAIGCLTMNDSALAFPVTDQSTFLIQYLLVGVIAGLVLLPAVFGADGPGVFRRFLRHPVPTWLGLVSYGIFLWQFPVMFALIDLGILDIGSWIDFPLLLVATTAGTVACAAISYYALERPLQRWERGRPPDPRSRSLPGGTAQAQPQSET